MVACVTNSLEKLKSALKDLFTFTLRDKNISEIKIHLPVLLLQENLEKSVVVVWNFLGKEMLLWPLKPWKLVTRKNNGETFYVKQASWGSLTTPMLSIWKGLLQEVYWLYLSFIKWTVRKWCHFMHNKKSNYKHVAYSKWMLFLVWTD